ncbi:MAG: tyrosine-protein phosphatase [Oscillospiraceae bacterium]|jgi:protein-tyrosine phosphatase|nr:tyrosine-protein phosphatase [Oscillospiraceae bacterium]
MTQYRRLPLATLHNARELGGYPIVGGGVTRHGVFVRCEAPCNLPESDLEFLRNYGLKLAVDFRGDREVNERPSALLDLPWVEYKRSPTFNDAVAFASRNAANNAPNAAPPVTSQVVWGEKYIDMAETCKEWIAETLTILANADGCALFNCTTGKDRTGIIAALLLSLAGVGDEDIVADYCVSEIYLTEVYRPLLEGYNKHFPNEHRAKLTDPFFRTVPENMWILLDYLRDTYGGAAAYVAHCGVTDGTVALLRSKLVV